MSESDEPDDHRTEGVRIIGAQEAAEAAGRPDVVRRRGEREKRYGDRPDEPEVDSDLPRITISTTETEGTDVDRAGAPIVRPPEDPTLAAEPRWADDAEPTDDPRAGFGHARIIDAEQESVDEGPSVSWSGELEEPSRPGLDDPTQRWTAEDFAEAQLPEDGDAVDEPRPGHRVDRAYAALQESGEPDEWPEEPQIPAGAPYGEDPYDDELGDDDSFVLPHWTEPPTGQVPKVVIGDDAPDADALATFGSQPRWRDEGERHVDADFDDLVDDGPRLGALGHDESLEDDFFSETSYYEDDEYFDDEVADDDHVVAAGRGRLRGRRRGPRDDGGDRHDGGAPSGERDLVAAVAVGVGLVALGLLCFALGALPTALLATAVVSICAAEYFAAVRTSGKNPATLLGMASVIGLMVAAYTSGLAAYPVVLGLSAIAGLLWYLWVAPGEGAVENLGLTMLGVLWIGGLGSFATLFIGLGDRIQDASESATSNIGIGVLIAAVIATVAHDVGAYFAGKGFGSTPLSAASPNKTQEGLVGGVLAALIATVVAVGVIGIHPIGSDLPQAFIFALLCAIAAPLGDLVESFVKRDLGIKDMGSVLPGHGGVLDRFDAMLFVLPVAYFTTVLFDVWA